MDAVTPGGVRLARATVLMPVTSRLDSALESDPPFPSHRAPRNAVRIAYCVDTMQVGGTELNAVRTAERLDRSRFALTIISLQPNGPLCARYEAAGIPVLGFEFSSLYAPSALRAGIRFARWLRRERIQIVHCHDLYANLFAAPWARLAGVPSVIASKRWIHPQRNRALELANRVTYHLAHHVLANSNAVAAMLEKADRVARSRILTVPNFVDESAFAEMSPEVIDGFRRELGVPPNAHVVGCIARLSPVKDHASLLRAMHILRYRAPSVHIVLVGTGECRSALELMTRELGLGDRVHFAGLRPNEPNLHHCFDISVLVSTSEGFPNSLVEAMAAARPIIATRVGGNVDAVRADNGILVAPRCPEQLASAIEELVSHPHLRRSMGVAAAQIARREYHASAVIPALEHLYEELAARSVSAERPSRDNGASGAE